MSFVVFLGMMVPILGILTGMLAIWFSHKRSLAKIEAQKHQPTKDLKESLHREQARILQRLENLEYLYTARDKEIHEELQSIRAQISNKKEDSNHG